MGKKTSRPVNPRSVLVSLTSAANELGIPYSTLREAVMRGDVEHVRLSGRGRYWLTRDGVKRFLAQSTEAGITR